MTDAKQPLWAKEESVESKAQPAFAYRYWTSIENIMADPGVERVETDGPLRLGARGKTYLAGGGTADWVVAEVEPDRRLVIEMPLDNATLRFELRFEEGTGGGSVITQRASLFGPNAATFLDGVESGFGTSLRDGMRAVRDRIDAQLPP